MSAPDTATLPATRPHPSAGDAAPAVGRTRQPGTVIVTTVLGANALAVVATWIVVAVVARLHNPEPSEDWTGVILVIAAAVMMIAIALSTAIGIAVAVVRIGRPGWLSAIPSTDRAVRAGLRAAAWGLCTVLPIPVLVTGNWIIQSLNG